MDAFNFSENWLQTNHEMLDVVRLMVQGFSFDEMKLINLKMFECFPFLLSIMNLLFLGNYNECDISRGWQEVRQ